MVIKKLKAPWSFPCTWPLVVQQLCRKLSLVARGMQLTFISVCHSLRRLSRLIHQPIAGPIFTSIGYKVVLFSRCLILSTLQLSVFSSKYFIWWWGQPSETLHCLMVFNSTFSNLVWGLSVDLRPWMVTCRYYLLILLMFHGSWPMVEWV